jgi:hypothetical protein
MRLATLVVLLARTMWSISIDAKFVRLGLHSLVPCRLATVLEKHIAERCIDPPSESMWLAVSGGLWTNG